MSTKPEAVIIDMDDTLFEWPSGRKIKQGHDYAKRHHDAGRTLIILTARTHEYEYDFSHRQLVGHLKLPFIGPFCRPARDARFACDFKFEVYQHLSSIYKIVGAIDDDENVLDMWHNVAEITPGFEVTECPQKRMRSRR